MKLSYLREGFGYFYDPDNAESLFDTSKYIKTRGKPKAGTNEISKKDYYNIIRDRGSFNYSPEDRPEDFIKAFPIERRYQLPEFTPNYPLSTFMQEENQAAIYYAYEIRPVHNIDIPTTKSSQKQDYEEDDFVDPITQKYYDLVEVLKNHNILGSTSKNSLAFSMHYVTDKDKEILQDLYDTMESSGDNDITVGNVLRQIRKDMKISAKAHKQKIKKANRSIESQNRPELVKEKSILRKIAISFAQSLKHPSPKEEALKNQMIDNCVEIFNTLSDNIEYDSIVVPQSSSRFAAELAEKLEIANSITTIPKSQFKDVEIDVDELYNRAEQLYDNNKYHDRLKITKVTYDKYAPLFISYLKDKNDTAANQIPATLHTDVVYNNDDNFPLLWTAKEGGKLSSYINKNQKNPLNIKNVLTGDKRKYLKVFETPQESFENKRILIIDDNIVSGGTIEQIHNLISQQGPNIVDMFVPFFINI